MDISIGKILLGWLCEQNFCWCPVLVVVVVVSLLFSPPPYYFNLLFQSPNAFLCLVCIVCLNICVRLVCVNVNTCESMSQASKLSMPCQWIQCTSGTLRQWYVTRVDMSGGVGGEVVSSVGMRVVVWWWMALWAH